MKLKVKQLFLALFSLLLISSCAQSADDRVNITVLQLNDVYEMSAVSGGKLGGLARVQTLLSELKAANRNTYTVLSGDLLSPSAIGTANFDGKKIAGRQMVEILNAMHWDYFILGNHEFDLEESDLRAQLNEMKFNIISDNVLDANNDPFPNTTTCTQFEVEGIKIGILGITINSYDTPYAKIGDPLDSAKKAVQELKDKGSDIIIALTHQEFTDDITLAVEVPDIDIIMGGHEHENFKLLRGDDFTRITKADANAKTVFVHQLKFDKKSKELDISSELVFIDDQIEEDPAIAKVVQKWTDRAFTSFEADGLKPRDTVCITDEELDGTEASVRSKATDLTKLITRGFLSAYPKADASIMNGGSVRIDDKLPPGPITQYDILKISPFGGDISLVSMNGSTLVEALDIGSDNVGSGGFLQYSNISKDGEIWKINGNQIDDSTTYTIAISSYLVEKGDKGLDILTYAKNKVEKVDSTKYDFVQVVIDQFKKEFPGN